MQVIDEAWAAVRHGAGYFQSSLKLSRTYGVATVLVCHRPSDLTAQADDGTAAAKIAAERIAAVIGCTAFDAGPDKTPFVVEFELGVAEVEAGQSPAQVLEAASRGLKRDPAAVS